MNISYYPLNEKYIEEALELVLAQYDEERKIVKILPDKESYIDSFRRAITYLFNNGDGIIATVDDKLVGFVGGFEIDNLFGQVKGIVSPLFGHGIKKEYSSFLYKELYRLAAESWIKKSIFNHVFVLFAHNKEYVDQFFWMGFGLRCVDAIREVSLVNHPLNQAITIKKIDKTEIGLITNIHREHNRYYRLSPIFMPNEEEDPYEDLKEWFDDNDHHLWAAFNNGKAIGYMRIQPTGESIISRSKQIMNITGAFILKEERKTGIGIMLLNEIQKWLQHNNYSLCGVDFESINTTGSHFWTTHFTPYTYSVVRRIDERINKINNK